MENMETENSPSVNMGENSVAMSEGETTTKNKKKNKKKKRGQNKKFGIMSQNKANEAGPVNIKRKFNRTKKTLEKKKGAEPGTEESGTLQNRTNHQENTSRKPRKRRNHKDFAISSAKVCKSILKVLTLCLFNIVIFMLMVD